MRGAGHPRPWPAGPSCGKVGLRYDCSPTSNLRTNVKRPTTNPATAAPPGTAGWAVDRARVSAPLRGIGGRIRHRRRVAPDSLRLLPAAPLARNRREAETRGPVNRRRAGPRRPASIGGYVRTLPGQRGFDSTWESGINGSYTRGRREDRTEYSNPATTPDTGCFPIQDVSINGPAPGLYAAPSHSPDVPGVFAPASPYKNVLTRSADPIKGRLVTSTIWLGYGKEGL